MSNYAYDISVVVPLFNEEESLTELCDWITLVCTSNSFSVEIILIDDGSTDSSWTIVKDLSKRHEGKVKGIKFRRNYGKSAALNVGFKEAQGEVVITMDADLQDSPDEIPGLYAMIKHDGYHLVSGWKKKRYDPITKTVPTKLFNAVTRKVSGLSLHDFNCGLKAYHNKVVKNIEVYGEMHRYIPVIAKWEGFTKVGEKVVQHRARKYGVTKFGMNRFINGFLDLMTLTFVSKFGKKPMHFFGLVGTLMFALGFVAVAYLIGYKLYTIYTGDLGRLVTSLPQFYIAIGLMIIGAQMFLAGFIGELLLRNAPERNKYSVDEMV